MGQGEHLQVLAAFSLCDHEAYGSFASKLQSEMTDLLSVGEGKLGDFIDLKISSDKKLEMSCYAFEAQRSI